MGKKLKVQLVNASPDLVHAFRNFGEDVYRALRDGYAVSIDEIEPQHKSFIYERFQSVRFALSPREFASSPRDTPTWLSMFMRLRNETMANMRCRDAEGLGKPEEGFARAKVSPVAKPSLRAQASPLLPGHRALVAIHAFRGPDR